MRDNPVFRLAAKILFAPIILFGLYVQFHAILGRAGVSGRRDFAAAFILHGLVFGLEQGRRLISARVNLLVMAIGVMIYGGVGVVSLFQGGLFLDYTALTGSVGSGQHIGIILVELGVG